MSAEKRRLRHGRKSGPKNLSNNLEFQILLLTYDLNPLKMIPVK